MLGNLIIVVITLYLTNAVKYDTYYQQPLTDERLQELTAAGALEKCVIDIEPCDENEGSRIDGSCNNLKRPSEGAVYTPQVRLIGAVYDENFEPRKSKSGKPMKLPRVRREAILPVGISISSIFNMLMSNFVEYSVLGFVSPGDIHNYVTYTPYCCEEKGLSDYMCTPNEIPEDDPVHRFSGHRCMNQTRPMSFQNQGCAPMNTTPVRIDFPTPTQDLNTIYNFDVGYTELNREYEGGRLKVEIVNGRVFPSDGNSSCTIQDAIDTVCTRYVPNGFIGTNICSRLDWKYHNLCAYALQELNPGWSDDKIFFTCRDIVIATHIQILNYEMFTLLLGRENMLKKGIIMEDETCFRDIYDEDAPVQMLVENALVHRWFHVIQTSTQHKFTPNGTYVGSFQINDHSNRVELLGVEDDVVTILHGAVKQPGGGFDRIVDPDMADRCLGPLQETIDVFTSDIHKDGLLGCAPYVEYRKLIEGDAKEYQTFSDLSHIMSEENIGLLQTVFEHVEDIGLMEGIMMENFIEGGYVPDTAAYIIMEQIYRSILYDRHWYERPNRPNAFTPAQLKEIRKSTIAAHICLTGDEFTHIQRHAFLIPSEENPIVSCDEIPQIDFSAWKEETSDC